MESTVGQATGLSRSLTAAELATSASSGEKTNFLVSTSPFRLFSRLLSFFLVSSRHRSFCLVTSDPVLCVLAAIGGGENRGKGGVEEEEEDVIG